VKVFIDTAKLDEIREACSWGIVDGVIAASIRNARQVKEMAEAGADIATIPFNVIREMIGHPKTAEGIKSFVADVVPEYSALFK
jgi:transaldolase